MIKQYVKSYQFTIDAESDLKCGLVKANFEISKKYSTCEFIFRENVEGSVLPLLKKLTEQQTIDLVATDEFMNNLYSVNIKNIDVDKTVITFSYDYENFKETLIYKMKIMCSDVSNRVFEK